MEPVTRKRYTAEFKAQAVELVGLGKPVTEVAEELEIGSGVLYRWMRRLRREVANLKLENDILKKAAVILGTKPQSSAAR